MFETTRGDLLNTGLLNDRLVGVIGGIGLAVVACLLKILRKLK
jgi:hypothetical protein